MKVTSVINCCYEGLFLRRSLESVYRSMQASGFASECEIIVIADRANKTTCSVIDEHRDRVSKVIATDYGDLGQARNAGVEAASGELVFFLDGDDLWSRNWLGAAWAEYSISPPAVILHPQLAVFFGERSEVLVHPDWRDASFDPRGLVARNHWISLCGARRDLLLEHPLPGNDPAHGLGFEDWSWYAHMVAAGARHAVVPGTSHFVRLKSVNSMNASSRGAFRISSLEFAEYIAAEDPLRPYDL